MVCCATYGERHAFMNSPDNRFTVSLNSAQGREVMQPRPELLTLQVDDQQGSRTVTARGRSVCGGAHGTNAIVVHDTGVSGVHFELTAAQEGVSLRDLGSKNGTWIGDDVRVIDAWLRPGASFRVGDSSVRLLGIGTVEVPVSTEGSFGELRGPGAKMSELFAKLTRLAALPLDVLLVGETGTGKELITRALHEHSPRGDGPLVVLDCTTISEGLVESTLFGHDKGAFTGATTERAGLLEQADGGTLFIDEIGELPLALQPKLLRALENQETRRVGQSHFRKFNARVVAATHRDLRRMVNDGKFRADLYFRLAQVQVDIPPLRERGKSDLVCLADLFLRRFADERGVELRFEPDVYDALSEHEWEGNVRELRNAVKCAAMLCAPPAVTLGDLPELVGTSAGDRASQRAAGGNCLSDGVFELPITEARAEFNRVYVVRLLERTNGNQSEAARQMGMHRGSLRGLLKRLGVI